MKYKMQVTVVGKDYNTGENGEETFDLTAEFSHDPTQYGNGHYVAISGRGMAFGREVYDIRYDTGFRRDSKAVWLMNWAHGRWSGKNGAWKVKKLTVEHMD